MTVQFIQSIAIVSLLLAALPAAADPPPPTVQAIQVPLIEWDLPAIMDSQPGAMVVDTLGQDKNRVWFVTRLGDPPRLFRFDPPKSLLKGSAQWTSWELSQTGGTGFSGGLRKLRPSYDRRYVFVRTQNSLQRIDTQDCDSGSQTCTRTVWLDQVLDPEVFSVSDVAVDDQNHVYTATSPTMDPASGYIQRLTPGPAVDAPVNVTRWNVGGGAGFCESTSTSTPCAAGIAVRPNNRNLVYYSEPGTNSIGELNVSTNKVRRWSLALLGVEVTEPRQLHIDPGGKIWVVTGSGHVVSLDVSNNRMTKHQMPLGNLNDPFGVAPDDDVVGYTASDAAANRVGMVHPKGTAMYVPPTTPVGVDANPFPVEVKPERAPFLSNTVPPNRKVVDGQIVTKSDGIFVEAFIGTNGNDSQMPLGITPNKGKAEGTFFYAVGLNSTVLEPSSSCPAGCGADRIGFVRLHLKEKVKHPRDDDDPDDGYTGPVDGGHHWGEFDDDDDDGIENEYDTTSRENVQAGDPAPLGGGQSVDYPVTTSATSLALIGTSTADDPLAQIGVDIYNAAGSLVATSPPTPGLAVATVLLPAPGNYKVRVRNYGALPITQTPKFLVREPWN